MLVNNEAQRLELFFFEPERSGHVAALGQEAECPPARLADGLNVDLIHVPEIATRWLCHSLLFPPVEAANGQNSTRLGAPGRLPRFRLPDGAVTRENETPGSIVSICRAFRRFRPVILSAAKDLPEA